MIRICMKNNTYSRLNYWKQSHFLDLQNELSHLCRYHGQSTHYIDNRCLKGKCYGKCVNLRQMN